MSFLCCVRDRAATQAVQVTVFRYILCHKALGPLAGIRAAVEKRRQRFTEVRSTGKAGGPLQTQHLRSALTSRGCPTE